MRTLSSYADCLSVSNGNILLKRSNALTINSRSRRYLPRNPPPIKKLSRLSCIVSLAYSVYIREYNELFNYAPIAALSLTSITAQLSIASKEGIITHDTTVTTCTGCFSLNVVTVVP